MNRLTHPSRRWLILTAILLLTALMRFPALDRVPPGWRDDELIEIEMDTRIQQGWRPLYIREAEGHEPLYHYLHAGTLARRLARHLLERHKRAEILEPGK